MELSKRPSNVTALDEHRNRGRRDAIVGLEDFIGDARTTYTVEEAAALLGISKSAAYDCARSGELPVLRMGRRLLVTRVTLVRLLDLDVDVAGDRASRRQQPRRVRWRRVTDRG